MRTLKRYEGYLEIDHRESPGFSEAEALAAGLPPPLFAKGTLTQRAIVQCHVCQRGVVLNPDRTRPRHYCPKHDAYTCDDCEAARVARGGDCKPFKQLADETREAAVKQEQQSRGLILIGGKT